MGQAEPGYARFQVGQGLQQEAAAQGPVPRGKGTAKQQHGPEDGDRRGRGGGRDHGHQGHWGRGRGHRQHPQGSLAEQADAAALLFQEAGHIHPQEVILTLDPQGFARVLGQEGAELQQGLEDRDIEEFEGEDIHGRWPSRAS